MKVIHAGDPYCIRAGNTYATPISFKATILNVKNLLHVFNDPLQSFFQPTAISSSLIAQPASDHVPMFPPLLLLLLLLPKIIKKNASATVGSARPASTTEKQPCRPICARLPASRHFERHGACRPKYQT